MAKKENAPSAPTKALALRELIASGKPIVTPGAHDALSARLIAQSGFPSLALGGSAMLASRYGLPDIGLAGHAEMVETLRDIVRAVSVPCIADADDGYGDVKNLVRTVRAYEEIGVAGFLLEDQERVVKSPGESAALAVCSAQAMVAKLKAAVAHRCDPATVVIARTDCYAVEGIDGVLRRCEAYLEAGADGVFAPGLASHEHLAKLGEAFPGVYKVIVQVEGSRTPWLAPQELYRLGYTQIVYPAYLLYRAILAITGACRDLRDATASGIAAPVLSDLGTVSASFEAAVQMAAWRGIGAAGGRA